MEEQRRQSDNILEAAHVLSEARANRSRARLEAARAQRDFEAAVLHRYRDEKKRRPPESGMTAPVDPPKGPSPMQGGAAAGLDFHPDSTRQT